MSELNGVYGALVKAQEEFPSIGRDKSVKVTSKSGASYTFKYAPLDSIMAKVGPVLAQNGLALTQPFGVSEQGGPILETMLIHTDGSMIRSQLPLPVHQGATAQELGSLITYCRRYAIVAILGLATEDDDDANHASGNTVQARQDRSQATGDGQASDPHGLQQSRGDAVQTFDSTDKQQAMIRRLEKKLGIEPGSNLDALSKGAASARIEELLAMEEGGVPVSAPGGADLDADIPFAPSEF